VEPIHDLEPIEVSDWEAQKFKMQHSDKCDIWAGEDGQWFAKFKKGAYFSIPKAFKFGRTVARQIPTGWEAGRYHIPEDIVARQTAPLCALVCTAEAFNASISGHVLEVVWEV
jgi:fatty acid synthase subunit alpha